MRKLPHCARKVWPGGQPSGKAQPEIQPQDNLCGYVHEVTAEQKAAVCFQPILDLTSGVVLGYEALGRRPRPGPGGMPGERSAADGAWKPEADLERLCVEKALQLAAECRELLFIDLGARSAAELARYGAALPETARFTDRMVLEIPGAGLEAAGAAALLKRHRRWTVAVDSPGLGEIRFASLEKARPEYIRLDSSLIKQAAEDRVKKALITAMVEYAHSIGTKVIAAGIETRCILAMVLEMDIDYGQGLLLAPPASTPQRIRTDLIDFIRTKRKLDSRVTLSGVNDLSIGDIVQYSPATSRKTLVSDVEPLLTDEYEGVVIQEEGKPIGLLMRNQLYFQLGARYGVALYYQRPVELVMDKQPLIVEATLSLETVSKMVMNRRDTARVYDLVIIVRDGLYLGTVSIMHLLQHLTDLKIRYAANANPLTGLPGNMVIEEKLKAMIAQQIPFSVLYIDLDNFKAFNDKYGFERGDKAIMLTASILDSCLSSHEEANRDFLGHIGGDDFVILARPEKAEVICNAIIRDFDREIPNLYAHADRERGYIIMPNRRGQVESYPIMSISIAVVDNRNRRFENYLEIGEIAAELKKQAKSLPGSVWVGDRRRQSAHGCLSLWD
ncbi:MAG TPA: GGDEF domain-containing protein [Selenomonadales bacterium]|nr:GGDEF domain-containing protein [Selenomonadales bacterium]